MSEITDGARNTPVNPWERLDKESSQAFEAFKAFRDAGPERSIDATYRVMTGKATRAPNRWRTWSKAFTWKKRVVAWDARVDLVAQAAREKVIAEHAAADQLRKQKQRDFEDVILTAVRQRALDMMKIPLLQKRVIEDDGKTITIYEPAKWTFRTAVDFARFAMTWGRVNAKMPVEVTPETDLTEFDPDERFI